MSIFGKLRAMRVEQRKHLPYLESLEDLDIFRLVGHAQDLGQTLGVVDILDAQIGTGITVRRRIRRLIKLGVIQTGKGKEDVRKTILTLSAKAISAYKKTDC